MKTHLDLFSGIGGFALACRWNNIQTIGFCEIEDYPRRVLERHFPNVRIHRDIRDLDGSWYKGVSLITAGLPCQPFSRAGKQRGQEDDRWLWSEMLRVVIEAQPTYLIIENVAGFIDLALDTVCADLEAEDYATGTVVLGACAKNAPHRRQRIWIIAKRLGNSNGERFQEQQVCVQQGRQDQTRSEVTRSGPDVAHTQCQSLRNEGSGQDARKTSSLQGELRERQRVRVDPSECGKDVAHTDSKRGRSRDSKRQDAEDAGQSSRGTEHGTGNPQSHLGRRTDGLSEGLDMPRRWGDGTWEEGIPRVTMERKNRTHRLKALGNAIVPQIAYELIRCMKEIDESE